MTIVGLPGQEDQATLRVKLRKRALQNNAVRHITTAMIFRALLSRKYKLEKRDRVME